MTPDTRVDPAFDLEAYLRRIGGIGHGVARTPTCAALRALCAAHPAAIPFENIDPLLGRPPSLRLADVQAKLVEARRGGYCFEQNALLRQALLAFGFGVTSLAARVRWMAAPDAPRRPRTHMLLRVELPDAPRSAWLVDAGFGGHLIDAPLRWPAPQDEPSPHDGVRLRQADDTFTLEARLPEGWAPLYEFTLAAQVPADYEPLNWFTATHPDSLFRHNLVMARLAAGQRANLLNDRLTLRAPGAAAQVRRIGDAAEFERVMREVFALRLPLPAAELFERLPRGLDGPLVPATPR